MKPKFKQLLYPIVVFFGFGLVTFFGLQAISTVSISKEAYPEISAQTWLNSKPLTLAQLRGKVILVKFWTFGYYNCNNVEPYVKAWYQKYHDKDLEIIAVHSPEFNYEKSVKNVRKLYHLNPAIL